MRWPIRNQIFVPFAGLLLGAVGLIAVTSAALSARRISQERIEQLHRVEAALAGAAFPLSENVLRKMRGLSGAHFIALDKGDSIVRWTFDRSPRPGDKPPSILVAPSGGFDSIEFNGSPYFASAVPANGTTGISVLLILYPRDDLRQAQWQAAWPPLAIGGITILVMIAVSAWLSGRLGGRIQSVRQLFFELAEGSFQHAVARPPFDEVYDLSLSANRLSDRLAAMQDQVARTERLRLLAQLAGGFAHQLRNAVTGARMAVQLHQRRCPVKKEEESLDVALAQLSLTEEQVRGLLSLGRKKTTRLESARLSSIIPQIDRLVRPTFQHGRMQWNCELPNVDCDRVISDGGALRAGLLNLVLNAGEAAGPGGRVRLWIDQTPTQLRVHIADSGPGVPAALEESLFEPFASSKPEGIGLGLALAQEAAAANGGEVTWSRVDGETVFTMSLSRQPPGSETAPEQIAPIRASSEPILSPGSP